VTAVRACALAELAPESALAVDIDGAEIAVVRSGDRVYAVADECSHASIPLSEGDVEDGTVECYLHGSRFDLLTGEPTGLPATEPVAVYRCRVVGPDIFVDLDAAPDAPEFDLPSAATSQE
jgi:3-phenylpropionate/trans-cinnamate dioxygenase ferredoxin subunit